MLRGRVAVVTGGSRGIGRATAVALAGAGASVVICARHGDGLADAATAIAAAGGTVLPVVADVGRPTDVAALARRVGDVWGHVDVLVNNAAVLGPVGPLDATPADEWVDTVRLNVGSVAAVTAAMLPLMPSGSSVVNLSGGGIGGPNPPPRISAYVASKAAIVALTEVLARELEPRGVRVNAVAPGPVATAFTEPIVAAGRERAGPDLYDSTLRQRAAGDHLDRLCDLVVWLASADSEWLSGRLLSARWDGIEDLRARRHEIQGSSLLTLRRIDGHLYREIDRR